MKRKVLFCVPPNVGGAERVTLTIAKLLDREKYDIKVVIVGRTMGEIKEFIPDYMDIIHVKVRNIWDFFVFKLYMLFRRERPNVVFCSFLHMNTRIILAAKLVGNIKIVLRNNSGFHRRRKDHAFLIKYLYPRADVVIMQTEEMKREMMEYLGCDGRNMRVIFNPIDTETITKKLTNCPPPYSRNLTNYVFVGRVNRVKGLDVLIESFAKVVSQNDMARLYIVGKYSETDSYYQSLLQQANELNIQDKIIYTSFTDNPYQYIKYADCFVLPSRIEGLPNVLLDAMYLGVPVVATRSVPVIDRIVPKQKGFVVDVEDVQALACAMQDAVVLSCKNAIYEHQSSLTSEEWNDLF